jgi:hypothetical protein
MNPETLFSICNFVAMAGWLLLVVAPRWAYTRPVIFSGIILLLAALYILLIISSFGEPEGGGFSSLAQVAKLFENPLALLAGWVHYLAFDLLVGCWMSADARKVRIPHLALVPCLFFTFMFGPFGYLLYRGVRLFKLPKFLIDVYGTVPENAA